MTSMTDNRTTELLPCPFCGGEAELKLYQSGDWQIICYHSDGCIMRESDLDDCYWENVQTCARQWNTRADYHGYEQAAIEAWESIKAWNTRADTEYGGIPATDENMAKYGWVREQTCEWLLEHSGTLYDKWRCSECGYEYVESRTDGGATELDPRFCPNCGAKVVSA